MKHKPLNLEFAPQARRLPMARLIYLLLALGVFVLAGFAVGQAHYEQTQMQQQLAEQEGLSNPPASRAAQPAKRDPAESARAQWVRQTSQRLSTPWADLLAALESAPANVALLVVEPSAAKHSVSLTAEAANSASMLAYLQALQADARLTDVALVSHQIQLQAPGTPLRFQLRAQWGETP